MPAPRRRGCLPRRRRSPRSAPRASFSSRRERRRPGPDRPGADRLADLAHLLHQVSEPLMLSDLPPDLVQLGPRFQVDVDGLAADAPPHDSVVHPRTGRDPSVKAGRPRGLPLCSRWRAVSGTGAATVDHITATYRCTPVTPPHVLSRYSTTSLRWHRSAVGSLHSKTVRVRKMAGSTLSSMRRSAMSCRKASAYTLQGSCLFL